MPLLHSPLGYDSHQQDACSRVLALRSFCLKNCVGYKTKLFESPLLIKPTIALTHKTNKAVSITLNATSSPFPATSDSYTTSASPNVSMCQVEQNGLGPVDGGPLNPDVYSTACLCSNLIHSFVSEIPSPYRYLHTLTTFETLPAVKDPNYLYVATRLEV